MSLRNDVSCYFNKHCRDNKNINICNPSSHQEIALIGDSHAGDLWFALNQSLPDTTVIQMTGNSCAIGRSRLPRYCLQIPEHILPLLKARKPRIKAVVLCSTWSRVGRLRMKRLKQLIRSFREIGIGDVYIIGPRPSYKPSPLHLLQLHLNKPTSVLKHKIQQSLHVQKFRGSNSIKSMETRRRQVHRCA